MGIAGLLPALKSIQKSKHLSEFAGQTLAVDAYVWLHRGVHTCATELATGRATHKYVDYAMHRVRLLRHHRITPYIVFDGGLLPAKLGTETDRKKRREENLSRANMLAAQGKHSQAREYYVKCVDVTPQMAYQFIKALRVEAIPYIVAPYEADAQMAYLERMGIVNGIITEDSDLLVFGCRNVLFKLDIVTSTVVSICRDDFGSVVASDSAGISLLGWSDVQFRTMAILSGCDYLPSIPGVGLKTACTLLRKWKTLEQVVRVITMEGKKSVPPGYLRKFRLAEKCFLHQRVYSPMAERLVHLIDVDCDWSEVDEAYVGPDMAPSVAKGLALGDVDPLTLLPMEDINPTYKPRVLKPLPLVSVQRNSKDKGKAPEKAACGGGLFNFFGPSPSIPPRAKSENSKPIMASIVCSAGKESGKRTLAGVMDQDIQSKRRRPSSMESLMRSRFFGASKLCSPSTALETQAGGSTPLVTRPSHLYDDQETVDVSACEEHFNDPEASIIADVDSEIETLEEPPDEDPVKQEDGYISPSQSCAGDSAVSSPMRPSNIPRNFPGDDDIDFGAEAISSPPAASKQPYMYRKPPANRQPSSPPPGALDNPGNILVDDSPEAPRTVIPSLAFPGPDLRDCFGDDLTSEIDCFEELGDAHSPPSPSPPTPITPAEDTPVLSALQNDPFCDIEEIELDSNNLRQQAVAKAWRDRWTLGRNKVVHKGTSGLRRSETTITPIGRRLLHHQTKSTQKNRTPVRSASTSLIPVLPSAGLKHEIVDEEKNEDSQEPMNVLLDARMQLGRFRCAGA